MDPEDRKRWQATCANMMQISDEVAGRFMTNGQWGPASYFALARDMWASFIAAENIGARHIDYIKANGESTYFAFYPKLTKAVLDGFLARDHAFVHVMSTVLPLWSTHVDPQEGLIMNEDNVEGEYPGGAWIDQALDDAIAATRHRLRCSCPACQVQRRDFEGWLGTKEDPTITAEPSLGKE
jgi:hypothetical protein